MLCSQASAQYNPQPAVPCLSHRSLLGDGSGSMREEHRCPCQGACLCASLRWFTRATALGSGIMMHMYAVHSREEFLRI